MHSCEGATISTFVQTLQAQPWYNDVANIFAEANVPRDLWEATLAVEDSSLDPSVQVLDHYKDGSPAGYSYGLFQLNQNGLGANQSITTLTNAEGNAQIAASAMSAALSKLPAGATLPQQLQAIEEAGWNGSLDQDATRQSALQSIETQNGETPATSGGFWQGLLGGAGGSAGASAGAQNGASFFGINANTVNGWIFNATAVGLFLALLAGGFAILAAVAGSNPTVQKTAEAIAA